MKINERLYKREILVKGVSAIAGEMKDFKPFDVNDLPNTGLVRAFLADDDIQEMTFVSTNIGFVRTYQKQFQPTKSFKVGK